jgi:hypothetical protein
VTPPVSTSPAAQAIRDALAAADRRRRRQAASARVWRAAPRAAAALLTVALVARWAAWPAAVPTAIVAAAAIGLIAYAWFHRRRRPLSDAAAAAIDAEAGLGGELRSAGWFAARAQQDPWADFHLERAAERLQSMDWSTLYPPLPAARARLATAVLMVAAVAISVTIPERIGVHPTAAAAGRATVDSPKDPRGELLVLPPELQRQLEALLAAAERGDLTAAAALTQNTELRDLLNRLNDRRDPELLEALARAMANTQTKTSADDLAKLADRARRAADSTAMSDDMKEALDKLASELEKAGAELVKDTEEAAAATPGSEQGEGGRQANAQSGMQDLSIQFTKDANAGGGAGVMMMTPPDGDQAAGPPGSGVGGSGSQDAAAGTATSIEAALKEELVEASEDTPGANVDADIRRKTERGSAAVGFSHAAAGTFDRSRAAAPPPVPEARRPGVQTYFVRKPQ